MKGYRVMQRFKEHNSYCYIHKVSFLFSAFLEFPHESPFLVDPKTVYV